MKLTTTWVSSDKFENVLEKQVGQKHEALKNPESRFDSDIEERPFELIAYYVMVIAMKTRREKV